jgi:hypothetical protein
MAAIALTVCFLATFVFMPVLLPGLDARAERSVS